MRKSNKEKKKINDIGWENKEQKNERNENENKTAVQFKPRFKAHGYSHCPTALLLLFLSLCERLGS